MGWERTMGEAKRDLERIDRITRAVIRTQHRNQIMDMRITQTVESHTAPMREQFTTLEERRNGKGEME